MSLGYAPFRSRVDITTIAKVLLIYSTSLAIQAGEFKYGNITGRANGSVTAGAIWNAEKPNSNYIYQPNADSIGYGRSKEFNPNGGRNSDDGRLNFRKRSLVSSPVTLMGEVELKYKNYGAFFRGKAWYDHTLSNREVDFGHSANGYRPNSKLDDSHFDDLAKFQGIALLDAYVFGDFFVSEHALHVRVGNQVVSWGESLFFQNGLNVINPIDFAAMRRPGVQLKEIQLPVPLVYTKFTLSKALSMEAFYQLQWRQNVLDGCGTYFSSNDYMTGDEQGCYGVLRGTASNPQAFAANSYIRRTKDNSPRDFGQFGLALRYSADNINTKFGAYAMNLHSRTPNASFITDRYSDTGAGWRAPSLTSFNDENNSQYFADYAENIRVFGLSLSSIIWGTSVFGEYSYRPNQPVQLASGDLIPAFAGNPAVLSQVIGQNITLGMDALNSAPGSVYNSYDRLEVSQLSLGVIKSFPQILGAENLRLAGEAAMKYMHDLPDLTDRRYNKSDVYGTDLVSGSTTGCAAGALPQYHKYACSSDGFTSKFAWGYRLRAQLNYQGFLAGVSVSPFFTFGQDIKGWSYDGNIVQGRLLGSVGIKADYLKDYSAEISWHSTGNTPYAATDRDFVALSLRMFF